MGTQLWLPAQHRDTPATALQTPARSPASMRPEIEQELAHTLLVELLAYQFASPVRWIETQDVFLAEKTAERIVEIGPR